METMDQLREAGAKAENNGTTKTGGEYVIFTQALMRGLWLYEWDGSQL